MHPDSNLNTLTHQDLPLPLCILQAFFESEAEPLAEEGVFLGTENIVSTGAR